MSGKRNAADVKRGWPIGFWQECQKKRPRSFVKTVVGCFERQYTEQPIARGRVLAPIVITELAATASLRPSHYAFAAHCG